MRGAVVDLVGCGHGSAHAIVDHGAELVAQRCSELGDMLWRGTVERLAGHDGPDPTQFEIRILRKLGFDSSPPVDGLASGQASQIRSICGFT